MKKFYIIKLHKKNTDEVKGYKVCYTDELRPSSGIEITENIFNEVRDTPAVNLFNKMETIYYLATHEGFNDKL